MAEFGHAYYTNLLKEDTVLGCIVSGGERNGVPVSGYRANPVEETAMNAAVSSGVHQTLEAVLYWEPENLDKQEEEDD